MSHFLIHFLWRWFFLVPWCLGSFLRRLKGWNDSRTGKWNDFRSPSFSWLKNQDYPVAWLPHNMSTSGLLDFLTGGQEFPVSVLQTPSLKLHHLLWLSLGSHTEPSLCTEDSQATQTQREGASPHKLMGEGSKSLGLWDLKGLSKYNKVSDLELRPRSFESTAQASKSLTQMAH